jgi:transcriptional regulator with XRE-family HTH domain
MNIQPLPIIDTDDISALLDEARQRHGLSSDEKLARLLGVSDQAIYRWRRGQIDKSARVLATLMRDRNPSPCT